MNKYDDVDSNWLKEFAEKDTERVIRIIEGCFNKKKKRDWSEIISGLDEQRL